jgi:mannose-6-phosphate isomerase-like protein (cupin superfamily)
MNLKEAFEEAKNFGTPAVFRNVFPKVPSWESFTTHLASAVKEPNTVRTFHEHYHVVEVYEHNLESVVATYEGYDEVYTALNDANSLGIMRRPVMLLATVIGTPELQRHRDPCDQMHWACVGVESWKVWVSEDKVLEFILNPGDVIFIPVGLYHQVNSVTPSAGITWSANIP